MTLYIESHIESISYKIYDIIFTNVCKMNSHIQSIRSIPIGRTPLLGDRSTLGRNPDSQDIEMNDFSTSSSNQNATV